MSGSTLLGALAVHLVGDQGWDIAAEGGGESVDPSPIWVKSQAGLSIRCLASGGMVLHAWRDISDLETFDMYLAGDDAQDVSEVCMWLSGYLSNGE